MKNDNRFKDKLALKILTLLIMLSIGYDLYYMLLKINDESIRKSFGLMFLFLVLYNRLTSD